MSVSATPPLSGGSPISASGAGAARRRGKPLAATARAPSAPAPSAKAWGLLFLLGAIWGGSFFFVEIALQAMPPLTLVAHRVVWAALALWLYLALMGRLQIPRDPRLLIGWTAMGLLNNAIPFTLLSWAQTEIASGLAAILNGMTAIFGVLLAAVFFSDERLSARKLAGAMFGLLGVASIIGLEALGGLNPQSLAQLAVLAAALAYAFASCWGRARLGGVSPEINALGMLTASALIMAALALLVDGPPTLALGHEIWLAIAALSVMATAAAYLLYFEILRLAGAANTMLVTLIVPPSAIALGAAFLGERLSLGDWIGFAAIAFGLVVIDGRLFRRR